MVTASQESLNPFPRPPWVANPLLKCPCGSGTSFAECCGPYEGRRVSQEARRLFAEGKLAEAERLFRADLTDYIGSVFSQTLFFLAREKPSQWLETLIHHDIEALDELAGNVARCLDARGEAKKALTLFENLARVPLPGLKERMQAMEALWWGSALGESERANVVLDCIDNIGEKTDRLLLQVYLQFRGHSMSASQQMRLVDMILTQAERPAEKLHYSTVRAMSWMEAGETDEAWRTVSTALSEYLRSGSRGDDFWSQLCLARAYECRWWLKRQEDDLRGSLAAFRAISLEDLNNMGAAEVLTAIGELLLKAGQLDQAEENLREALKRHFAPDTAIHLADLCLRRGNTEQAARDLALVEEGTLPGVYHLEYYTTRGFVALAQGNRYDVQTAVGALKSLQIRQTLFRVQRDQICIELLEALLADTGPSSPDAANKRRLTLVNGLREVAQYLELKPNFFGLGVRPKSLDKRPVLC